MENIATAPRLVRVRSRGQLTIPQDMREALSLDESTGLNIFRVGKVLIMSPKHFQRTSLANGVERGKQVEGSNLQNSMKLRGQTFKIRLNIKRVIHKKVGPALKHSAKGITP
jgi:bifunctional DNA-binding transcriptional regulator/antitoxin component of YhaV-PrlF toxin-antitoxin module